jgi:uncharacterized protein YbaA (DUF1428 family)
VPYAVCFVLPLARKKIAAYRKMARVNAKVWKRCGALQYREAIGDELTGPWGGIRCKPGETVVVGWVLYKSKAHRKQVNAKVEKDPLTLSFDYSKLPFDPKRMTYGGFKLLTA